VQLESFYAAITTQYDGPTLKTTPRWFGGTVYVDAEPPTALIVPASERARVQATALALKKW
jgi:hypothetical protein